MSARKETERTKFIQEKCQTLLTQMLRDEDNKYCVDCDAKGPRWASWNLGVFLCIRCAGIHRNLGVHISRVKSVNLDSWTPEQVVSLQQMGNSRARAVYEAQLPDGFRRPQTDSALESFIRAKYEHKKYMAREWVPPTAPAKVSWDKEIDEEMERQKRKKKSSASSSSTSGGSLGLGSAAATTTASDKKTTVATVKTPIPAPLPKPKGSNSPKTSRTITDHNSSGTQDLLGLSSPTSANGQTKQTTSGGGIGGINENSNASDVFTNFLSATPSPNVSLNEEKNQNTKPVIGNGGGGGGGGSGAATGTGIGNKDNSLAQQEQDFFNQVPNEKEKAKMTKDSIMALYATAAPTAPTNGLGQFNGGNQYGAPVPPMVGGFNQFGNQMSNYGHLVAHQAMTSGGGGVVGVGGGGLMSSTPIFGVANSNSYGISNATNLFGSGLGNQMIPGAVYGQSSPQQLQQQQQQLPPQQQPPNAFSSAFPQHMQPATMQAFTGQSAFAQPTAAAAATAASNGNLNQQFANLNLSNVWQ